MVSFGVISKAGMAMNSNVDLANPTYEQVLEQQRQIDEEIESLDPFVSDKFPISTLAVDFESHEIFLKKLEVLKGKFAFIRRFRRDGSCFYRAFGFALLENFCITRDSQEAERIKSLCYKHKEFLIQSAGHSDFTVNDFYDQFVDIIDKTVSGEISLDELVQLFNTHVYTNYWVSFLRLLVSSYLQQNADFYQSFVEEGRTLKEFCDQEVEPMVQEADDIHLNALGNALKSQFSVANCQLHGDLKILIIPEEVGENFGKPFMTLLYRPGHYDLLYVD